MGALQSLALSHMGSALLQRAWGTADAIPQLCTLLRTGALPMRCLAVGALSNFALGSSDATVSSAFGHQTSCLFIQTSLMRPVSPQDYAWTPTPNVTSLHAGGDAGA